MSYHQQNRGHRNLLGWFILLSLLAHGALLTLPDRPPKNNHRLDFSSPIQVTVISSKIKHASTGNGDDARHRESAAAAAQTAAQSTQETVADRYGADTASHHEKMQMTKPATVEKTPKASTDKSVEESVEKMENDKILASETPAYTETTVATAETANQENLSINHLLHQLRALIKARFTYPRMARRMGWEGLVALSLHIEDDGSLHNVSIARSSGHRVLDEDARNTVERIGRLQIASSLDMQAIDTEVEVLYRLTD